MNLTYEEAVQVIKANQQVSSRILKGREMNRELCALIDGEAFHEELVNQIEHIESDQKIKARKKYSRSIVDFFGRLMSPIENIFSSSGEVQDIKIENESNLKLMLESLSNCRDGKSLRRFIQEYWANLYHTDPNGIIFIEYVSTPTVVAYPTYKGINTIRNYKEKGQSCDWVLFEPTVSGSSLVWRLVDSQTDWTITQTGEGYALSENTFTHPFGQCPAVIISDILDIKRNIRISAFAKVVPIAKEYARDQSIKTLYKFLHGFPTHWRYVTQCRSCAGTGRKDANSCKECDGHGYMKKKDVTDLVTLPIPTGEGVKLAPDIAGFISPDLATWDKYTEELELLDRIAFETHWGTHQTKGTNETATGRFIDVQPVKNRLNKYADSAEYIEWRIIELIANAVLPTKPKTENICLLNYGRRYIIEGPDTLLKNYTDAKLTGANITVLDKLFAEFITSKYMNDPDWLRLELTKSKVEPYLHLAIVEVFNVFGVYEAKKKAYFQTWWVDNKELSYTKQANEIRAIFELDFTTQNPKEDEDSSSEAGGFPPNKWGN